jgi:BirA family biotin operon repressor/biotin-[acetyl-CoA-carboxylase] ligase
VTRALSDAAEWAGPWLGTPAGAWRPIDAPEWAARLTGSPSLVEAELPGWPGWDAVLLARHAPRSQMDALAELHESGVVLPRRLLCHAEQGLGFHGQRERAWATHPGNLHVSARWPLELPVGEVGHVLTTVPALAVADALSGLDGLGPVGLKWVNDVLVGGAKIAGVLVRTHLEGDRFESAVFGIGLNVETAPALPGDPFVPRATCVRDELGGAGSTRAAPGALAEVLAGRLRARAEQLRREGPRPLVDAYRKLSVILGRRVVVCEDRLDGAPGAELARGRVTGIGDRLELHIAGVAGTISRGRLALEEPGKRHS